MSTYFQCFCDLGVMWLVHFQLKTILVIFNISLLPLNLRTIFPKSYLASVIFVYSHKIAGLRLLQISSLTLRVSVAAR